MCKKIPEILIDATPSINDIRAIQRYCANLLLEFAEIESDFFFNLLYFSAGNKTDIPVFDKRHISSVVSKLPGKLLMFSWSLFSQPKAEFWIKKTIDLFHFPGGVPYIPSHCKKIVSTIHGCAFDAIPQFIRKDIVDKAKKKLDFTINNSDFFITVSETNRLELIKNRHLPPEKIMSVPLGVSNEFKHYNMTQEIRQKICHAYKLPNKQFILFVGAIEPHKNIDSIILSYAKLHTSLRKQYPLVLVGKKGEYYSFYYDMAVKEGVIDDIYFVDYIRPGSIDLAYIYNMAKIFIFPSYYESWASPPLEAMKCGIPVIASNIPALQESTGKNALYSDPYDINDITEKMLILLEDKETYARLMKNGFAFAKHFTWKRCAIQTINVYKKILNV